MWRFFAQLGGALLRATCLIEVRTVESASAFGGIRPDAYAPQYGGSVIRVLGMIFAESSAASRANDGLISMGTLSSTVASA